MFRLRFPTGAFLALLAMLVAAAAQAASARPATHRVQPGQTLGGIARRHGVTLQHLQKLNGLQGDRIQSGQVLKIAATPEQGGRSKLARRADQPPLEVSVRRKELANPWEAAVQAPPWVLELPAAATQRSLEYQGVDTCHPPEPSASDYGAWLPVGELGLLLLPHAKPVDAHGGFDLFVHFHGRELTRNQWMLAGAGVVLLAVDVGIDSNSYAQAFAHPDDFQQLLSAVRTTVAKRTGQSNARVRNLGVSAWGAGYGAIDSLLSQAYAQRVIDSVVVLDSIHTGYSGSDLNRKKLEPYVAFAQRATQGERFLFVSHSSIIPRGYASTTETASYLIWQAGGQPEPSVTRSDDPFGLELIRRFSRGSFHVRGFAGNDTADHCAQVGLLADILEVHVLPRWRRVRPAQRSARLAIPH